MTSRFNRTINVDRYVDSESQEETLFLVREISELRAEAARLTDMLNWDFDNDGLDRKSIIQYARFELEISLGMIEIALYNDDKKICRDDLDSIRMLISNIMINIGITSHS